MSSFQWYFQDSDSWKEYSEEVNTQLELALQNNQLQMTINIHGAAYDINLLSREQTRRDNKKKRKMKREELTNDKIAVEGTLPWKEPADEPVSAWRARDSPASEVRIDIAPEVSTTTAKTKKASKFNTKSAGDELNDLDKEMARVKKHLNGVNKNIGIKNPMVYKAANFMFLWVILGIEFDMAGLSMSAATYWDYDLVILRFFLFFQMFAFIAPLALHFFWQHDSGSQTYTSSPPRRDIRGDDASDDGGQDAQAKKFLKGLTKNMKPNDPFGGEMQLYHCVPGVRFYLLIKSVISLTDVENMFKVNTLSSFTFGVYQLMGIAFTFYLGKEINIFVKMNIASQFLNWSITFMYFMTPVSVWMGRAADASRIQRLYQGMMNLWSNYQAQSNCQPFCRGERADQLEKQLAEDKKVMKDKIAKQIVEQFAGLSPAQQVAGTQMDLESLTNILKYMRDSDVKHFIEILRDQAVASVEMGRMVG